VEAIVWFDMPITICFAGVAAALDVVEAEVVEQAASMATAAHAATV
jgi:hypothetical protein